MKSKSMREFIRKNREKIDEAILQRVPNARLTDAEQKLFNVICLAEKGE